MVELFASLKGALIVLGLSMVPLVESKAAIPIGISVHGVNPWVACIAGIIGMVLAAAIVLSILVWATDRLRLIHPRVNALIDRVFATTHHKHTARFERYGTWALFLYVAMPIPFAGVWSGALLAHLFGIKYRHALLALSLGSLVTSILFTLGTVGVLRLTKL